MDCAHPYALAHGALEGTGLGFWQNRSRVVASFTFAIVAFASSPFNSAVPLYRFFFSRPSFGDHRVHFVLVTSIQ